MDRSVRIRRFVYKGRNTVLYICCRFACSGLCMGWDVVEMDSSRFRRVVKHGTRRVRGLVHEGITVYLKCRFPWTGMSFRWVIQVYVV